MALSLHRRSAKGEAPQPPNCQVVQVRSQEPRLLVRELPLSQGRSQRGHFMEPALQRRALRDRPPRHAQTLGAVMIEGGEPQPPPSLQRAEDEREVPEDLVPPVAQAG